MALTLGGARDVAAQGSPVQYSRDKTMTIIQKDFGNERWSIVHRIEDGYTTGNVFFADGSGSAFLSCLRIGVQGDDFAYFCYTAGACEAEPCSNPYDVIGDVTLNRSFFFPPDGASPPRPTPRPTPAPPPASGLEALIGTWDFSFEILTRFTERYRLQEVRTVSGRPTLIGLDQYGDTVVAAATEDLASGQGIDFDFALLDSGLIICNFYAFNRTSETTISGVYLLVDVDSNGDCVFRSPTTGGSPTVRDLDGRRVSAGVLSERGARLPNDEVSRAREYIQVIESAAAAESLGAPLATGRALGMETLFDSLRAASPER